MAIWVFQILFDLGLIALVLYVVLFRRTGLSAGRPEKKTRAEPLISEAPKSEPGTAITTPVSPADEILMAAGAPSGPAFEPATRPPEANGPLSAAEIALNAVAAAIHPGGAAATVPPPAPEEGRSGSTLSEKNILGSRLNLRMDRPSFEAYEAADQLLAKGVELREISRRTGLSLSELQLLGKISQRNQ